MPVKFAFSKRERMILFFLIGLLAVYGGYLYGYVPVLARLDNLDRKIRVARRRLAKNRQVIARVKESGQEVEKVLKRYWQRQPDEEVMAGMLSAIEQEARDIGILVADLKPRKGKKLDLYNHFSVSLAVEGDMTDVLQFVYRLQAQPHGFDIDDIRISRKSSRAQALRGQMILSALTIKEHR